MIAESLARSQRDFDAFLEEKVDMDWEDQRQKIFHHFGLSQKDAGGDLKATSRGAFGRSARQSKQTGASAAHGPSAASRRSVFGRSGLEKSVIGTPGAGLASRQLFEDPAERSEGTTVHSADLRFLREKMGHYAEKVQQLNTVRLQKQVYPILHEFADVEKHTGGDVSYSILIMFDFIPTKSLLSRLLDNWSTHMEPSFESSVRMQVFLVRRTPVPYASDSMPMTTWKNQSSPAGPSISGSRFSKGQRDSLRICSITRSRMSSPRTRVRHSWAAFPA